MNICRMGVRPYLLAPAAAASVVVALWFFQRRKRRRKVVITGACGNLGSKLGMSLAKDQWIVVGIEHPAFVSAAPWLEELVVDDVAVSRGRWRHAFEGADCVVHFSAVNPYPNASWAESAASMDHAINVMIAAERCGVRRVVIASSNHVMGGYKDDVAHGDIRPTDPPRCGTFHNDASLLPKAGDAVAYAAAKLAAERLAQALASPRTTFVTLRVGWCQPGENLPETLSGIGVPPQFQNAQRDAAKATNDLDEAWFKMMWLSNTDFVGFFTAALDAPLPDLQHYVVLNAMSANTGARWSLSDTVRVLGVRACDDVWSSLKERHC
ncbi:hypothetical protein CTAYLR_002710 [Chrysophaeum taylorii]|uniref:NAD-dependent epimerase/dehydratase domain-containing protein n=1 Tax=Chrysophaeum taylorii TaxID=2483200 RepID=A0AAD7XKU4_9STRA|nr:hypothetical protein CTAYLR_002710 [Chrysophaeum taylorii]